MPAPRPRTCTSRCMCWGRKNSGGRESRSIPIPCCIHGTRETSCDVASCLEGLFPTEVGFSNHQSYVDWTAQDAAKKYSGMFARLDNQHYGDESHGLACLPTRAQTPLELLACSYPIDSSYLCPGADPDECQIFFPNHRCRLLQHDQWVTGGNPDGCPNVHIYRQWPAAMDKVRMELPSWGIKHSLHQGSLDAPYTSLKWSKNSCNRGTSNFCVNGPGTAFTAFKTSDTIDVWFVNTYQANEQGEILAFVHEERVGGSGGVAGNQEEDQNRTRMVQ